MQFGLYLPNQAGFADPRVLASLARDAEHAGWDGIFMWDELFPIYDYAIGREKTAADGDVDWHAVADPIVAMTAIAAATEQIRFGALVTPVARLRPEAFAQQTATLDRFSGGRLILGVGLGNPDTQFVAFGHEGDVRIRAAQVWDGFAPVSHEWPHGVISAAQYREIVADIRSERTSETPFDVVLIGNADASVPSTSDLDEYAGAGVTWHLVQALTVNEAIERVRRGPPTRSQ
jgi:hypothetical protein